MMIIRPFSVFAGTLTACLAGGNLAQPQATLRESDGLPDRIRPPNIVIVNIDDMGYADPACYGMAYLHTPNMDQLAREGTRFTEFYVSQAVSSASRASLLTGCYANRISILGALMPNSKTGINDSETTIAEMLKARGYATAAFGKWHLGHLEKFLPLHHGFDEYFGLPYSNDMIPDYPDRRHHPPLPLIEGTRVIDTVAFKDQANLTTWYTERAVNFIRKKKDQPFFLYLAHSMVHVPLAVSPRFEGTSGKGLYPDVVAEVDWSLGEVMKTLKELRLEQNTLVIFISDNGPWLSCGVEGGRADPLREGKGTAWEGGIRVPCIMKLPGTIPAGSVCKTPCMTIDILPTLAELTGSFLPQLKIDGQSITYLLKNPGDLTPPHEALFFYYGKKLNALRWGDWKLHLPHDYTSLSGRPGGTGWNPAKYDILHTDTALYNLTNDIGEQTDVRSQNPAIVAHMTRMADSVKRLLGDARIAGSEVRPAGFADGYATAPKIVDHLATSKAVTMLSAISPKYPGKGPSTLTDGIMGTPQFDTPQWLGFEGNELAAVIDLGSTLAMHAVSVNMLQETGSWIFFPLVIRVYVSADGKVFEEAGSLAPEPTTADQVTAFTVPIAGKKARFVKVRVENRGKCPPGHPGEGSPAWLFADEVIVR